VVPVPVPGALAGGVAPDVPELPLVPPALPALPELDVPDPDAPEPVVPEPDVPAPPAAPLLLSVVGGVDGGGVVVVLPDVLPVLPDVLPDVLPEVPGELVLPVSVGSDLPHALKASKELKASASAGLKLKVFMGSSF